MIKRSRISIFALSMALALGASGCDNVADQLVAPQANTGTEYSWSSVLVTTTAPVSEGTYSAVVGRNGGIVRAGDHMLMIPSKAVDSDTEFTVRIVGGNNIVVDLNAKRVSDGATVSTFPVALTLRLSYKNAAVSDPTRLKNAYLPFGAQGGASQKLPTTISSLTQTLSSPITHFSEYGPILD